MKTFSLIALAAPVAAFTSQNAASTRQSSTRVSETKVRDVLRSLALDCGSKTMRILALLSRYRKISSMQLLRSHLFAVENKHTNKLTRLFFSIASCYIALPSLFISSR